MLRHCRFSLFGNGLQIQIIELNLQGRVAVGFQQLQEIFEGHCIVGSKIFDYHGKLVLTHKYLVLILRGYNRHFTSGESVPVLIYLEWNQIG